MSQYTIVAIVVAVAAAYVIWRVIRASAGQKGCGGNAACSSRGPAGGKLSRWGRRQQLVQLTVKKPDKED